MLVMSACSMQQVNVVPESGFLGAVPTKDITMEATDDQIIAQEDAYQLTYSELGESSYSLKLYDKNRRTIKEYEFGMEPSINIISENPLIYEFHGGIGAYWSFYYDYSDEKVSQDYKNIVSMHDLKIAYMTYKEGTDQAVLVVGNIFDTKNNQREYIRDFSKIANPTYLITDFKWINDTEIEVTYLVGDDYRSITEKIDLTKDKGTTQGDG